MATRRFRLPAKVIELCDQFGRDCSEGYARGDKPESSYYTTREIDRDPIRLSRAKQAECAVAIVFEKKRDAINWSDRPDDGEDLVLDDGCRVDVKQTELTDSHRCLMWPATKVVRYDQAKFDVLVLVKVGEGEAEVVGWTSKDWFRENHRVADEDHPLDTGDWYVDQDELWNIDELIARSHKPEVFPPGFVGYSAKGLFVHYCQCGAWGAFGFGVSVRTGKLGTWYCAEHNPERRTGNVREKDGTEGVSDARPA